MLETLTAIFVFSAGILGVFAVVQLVISATSISSSRLVASYLAQEGIEIVRNIRDSNWLEQRADPIIAWDRNLSCPFLPCQWEADYNDQFLLTYGGQYLKYDGEFYNYSFGEETRFQRKITITKNPEELDILKVWVQVFWEERGRSHEIMVQENLYNWR